MILFKKKAISIAQENCIMLEVENMGYVYLAKDTYDQSLLLSDRFEGEISYLKKSLLNGSANHTESIQYFYNTAPEPLNILAPYLGLVKEDVELGEDFELQCGALHMMSMAIDFNEFSKVPSEVRANVEFSKSTVRKYRQSWEDIQVKIKVADIDLEQISVDAVVDVLRKFLPVLGVTSVQAPQVSYQAPVMMNQPLQVEPIQQGPTEEVDEDGLTAEEREILNPDSPTYDFVKALELSAKIADRQLAEEEAAEAAAEAERNKQAGNVEVQQQQPEPVVSEPEPIAEEPEVDHIKTDKEKELEAIDSLIGKLAGI